MHVRAPYVSPADCVLAASCASLGFIPAQAGIGAIQCERTRATPEQSYFLLLWTKIGRLRNTKITGAGWSPLFHRDIIILHHDLDSGVRPRNDNFLFCDGVGWGGRDRTWGEKSIVITTPRPRCGRPGSPEGKLDRDGWHDMCFGDRVNLFLC